MNPDEIVIQRPEGEKGMQAELGYSAVPFCLTEAAKEIMRQNSQAMEEMMEESRLREITKTTRG